MEAKTKAEKMTILSFDLMTNKAKEEEGFIDWSQNGQEGRIRGRKDLIIKKDNKVLGKGASGTVQPISDNLVMKSFEKDHPSDRIKDECKNLWNADLHSVIGVIGKEQSFIVMPNLGQNLQEFSQSKQAKEQSFSDRTYALKSYFGELQRLHTYRPQREAAIIHFDIKPENVLMRPDPSKPKRYIPSIIDYDLSALLTKNLTWDDYESQITMTYEARRNDLDAMRGSMPYMPPDSFLGVYGIKTDIFSSTAIAIEFLGGQQPLLHRDKLLEVPYRFQYYDGESSQIKEISACLFTPFYHRDILSSQEDLSPFRQIWLSFLIRGFLDRMQHALNYADLADSLSIQGNKGWLTPEKYQDIISSKYEQRPNADKAVEFFSQLHALASLFEQEPDMDPESFSQEAKPLVDRLYALAFRKPKKKPLIWSDEPNNWEHDAAKSILPHAFSNQAIAKEWATTYPKSEKATHMAQKIWADVTNWIQSGETKEEQDLRLTLAVSFQSHQGKNRKALPDLEAFASPSIFPLWSSLNKIYSQDRDYHYPALSFSQRLFDQQLPNFSRDIRLSIENKKTECEAKKEKSFLYSRLAFFSSYHGLNKIQALDALGSLLKDVRSGNNPLDESIQQVQDFLDDKKIMKSLKSGRTAEQVSGELAFLENFGKLTPREEPSFNV